MKKPLFTEQDYDLIEGSLEGVLGVMKRQRERVKEQPEEMYDYLGRLAINGIVREVCCANVADLARKNIAEYLDGRYEHYKDCFPVVSNREIGWLDGHLDAIAEIRKALCGEK